MYKLLLLGPGGSGKSTFFKQMTVLYGEGLRPSDREHYKSTIFGNVIQSMQELLLQLDERAESDQKFCIETKNQVHKKVIQGLLYYELTPSVAERIAVLWKDPAVQRVYALRDMFQLPDAAAFYLNKVTKLAAKDYLPTEDDVLRSRASTTGVVTTKFVVKDNVFEVFDVGGQRSERKKWIHCFEDVACVLFVVAISAYNQVLFEEMRTNRLVEALKVFDSVCNNRYLYDTNIVLFLNKRDIYQEKIKSVPITACPVLNDYEGDPHAFEETAEYIESLFLELNQNKDKAVYPHLTCATDGKNVDIVFNSVRDTVITNAIRGAKLA